MARNKSLNEKVIQILLEDSRKSYRAIANELGVSTTTVSKIVKELEEKKVILRYTTLVDWKALDYESVLCLHIGIHSDTDVNEIGNTINGIPTVKHVHLTSNDLPIAAFVVYKDKEETDRTIESIKNIPGVGRVIHHNVYNVF